MIFCPKKKWKKRDSSDKEYMKLGDTPDERHQRADDIEKECRDFWMWLIGIVIAIFVGVPALFTLFSQGRWLPTYYPNPSDLTTYSNGPMLDSLDQCRDWIDSEAMRRNQESGEYDYECGLNCDLDNQYGIFVCDKTTQ